MKRIFKVIPILTICLGLVSCKKKPSLRLIDSQYGINDVLTLDKDSLKDKLSYEDQEGNSVIGDDFILYISTEGCSECALFENKVLKPFISETNAIIYKIYNTEIEGIIKTPKSYRLNPRLCLIIDGEIYTQTTKEHSKEVFEDITSFKEYIGKYFVINPMKYIEYDDLKEKIQKDGVNVYYKMDGCNDCAYFEEKILKNFIIDNVNKEWQETYIFVVNEFRKYKTEDGSGENENLYNDFIQTCDLDIYGNRGKYPTLINYKQGKRNDYCVYFNDTLEINYEKSIYKIINTPYNEGDIIGKEFNSYQEYQDGTNYFHYEKFIKFMNNVIK